jgi:DNA invertase Pin-like site-specific DNA recombinase
MSTHKKPKKAAVSPSGIAYSYVGFSRPEQLKGDSLRRQMQASEDYATEHGLRIDSSLRMQDQGISAFRGIDATKGALAGFLLAVQSGRVAPGATLLVESLDRLSRDQITEALTQFLGIINSGITVVTLMDKMVYSRATINDNPGSLLMSIGVMMRAHDES